MVQALVNISKKANHALNVVKAVHGLKDKSAAIEYVVEEYAEEVLEPEFKASYVKKLLKIKKERGKRIKIEDFGKHFGI
ncbi:MAG: antitoxin [Candidatus Micrarchaeia archaeon]